MSEPELFERQREILRTFRQATARRAKAEAGAEARRKANREAADAALNKVQQEAETQRTKAETDAEAHRKAEHQAASAGLDQARRVAAAQLAEARQAQQPAQAALAQAELRHLLGQTRSSPTTPRPGAEPAQELARCVSVATEVRTSIQAGTETLKQWREVRARLFEVLWVIGALVLFLLGAILFFIWWGRWVLKLLESSGIP